MLPNILLTLLFFLVAVCWPALQSLHALQVRSKQREVWLFYWWFLMMVWWCFPWVEWIVRIPFFIVETCFLELYGEAQIAAMVYLVSPWFMGVEKLYAHLSTGLSALVLKAMSGAMNKLAAAVAGAASKAGDAAGASKPKRDRPGPYTVIKQAGVMSTMETAKGSVKHHINIGDEINILEVVHNEAERRVRARLENPPGWISLLNMDSGTRWAVHKDDAQLPQIGMLPAGMLPAGNDVFANAAAAGCDPTAWFTGAQAVAPAAEVSEEEAWEAMAMLESHLARADDMSEDATSRQASGMLRQMLMTLVQTDNPAMLAMAQAMMPDLGKIWANESTRAYLRDLLSASAAGSLGSAGTTAGASSSGAAVASSSDAVAASSSGSAAGSSSWAPAAVSNGVGSSSGGAAGSSSS